MLLRQKPKDSEQYIVIQNSKLATKLAKYGFMPKYMWLNAYYYISSSELQEILGKEES